MVENVSREDDSESEPYAEITAAVQAQLNDRLKQVEADTTSKIQEAVKSVLERQAAKAPAPKKQKKEPDFRSKGNKKRYEVNEEIITTIEGAIENIGRNEIEDATSKLEAGKHILLKQQKLIRLADREENGWEFVRHYVSDDLASNSEDEKAIIKARKEALASINKRKAKRTLEFRSTRGKDRLGRDTTPRGNWSRRDRFDRYVRRSKSDICFKCGKEGHWQNACPTVFRH